MPCCNTSSMPLTSLARFSLPAVNSFHGGRAISSSAIDVQADIWRRFTDAHDKRTFPIDVMRVKAHATDKDINDGYPAPWREGNSHADAAAKLGRSRHPVDTVKTEEARRILLMTTTVAKFVVKVNIAALDAADDVPPFEKRDIAEDAVKGS